MVTTKIESDVLNAIVKGQKTEVELSAQKESVVRFLKDEIKKDVTTENSDQESLNITKELNKRVKEVDYIRRSYIVDLYGKVVADSSNDMKGLLIRDRNYFREAVSGEFSVSDVLHSKIDREPIIVLATPVKDEKGNIIGVFCNSFNPDYFERFTSNIKIGKTGYAYLVDQNATTITHPDINKIGVKVPNKKVQDIVKYVDRKGTNIIGMDWYTYNNHSKYTGYTYIPNLKWVLVVVQNIEEVYEPARLDLYIIIGITIVMIIFSTIASILASRYIKYP